MIIERRPKAEVGNDGARRDKTIGLQPRKALRAGQVLRLADLAKPDMVQRDQMVTLIYENDGLYLTTRAKALDNGSEGDFDLGDKHAVETYGTGIITGQNQVSISVATPRAITTAAINPDKKAE